MEQSHDNNLTLEGVKQYYIELEKESWKQETLLDLLQAKEFYSCIIYIKSKEEIENVIILLNKNNFSSMAFYPELGEDAKKCILNDFRNQTYRFLITNFTLPNFQTMFIINYDLPADFMEYLNKLGRSGAFGKKTMAINFVLGSERKYLKELEEKFQITIEELPIDFDELM